jgi:hypothetical protein
MSDKPIGGKSYGSIPHLSNSRVGEKDYHCHEGQERIATIKARDKNDSIIVQEKMDGSNVGVANVDGKIIALTRAGYVANTSPFLQHKLFYKWVNENQKRFNFLGKGERICGEWLAQAHGTIYHNLKEPLYLFDLFRDNKRVDKVEYITRLADCGLWFAPIIHHGDPITTENAMRYLGTDGCAKAEGGPEGLVYRIYRNCKFDYLCKYVRVDKVDGKYLPEISGKEPIWNYHLYGI